MNAVSTPLIKTPTTTFCLRGARRSLRSRRPPGNSVSWGGRGNAGAGRGCPRPCRPVLPSSLSRRSLLSPRARAAALAALLITRREALGRCPKARGPIPRDGEGPASAASVTSSQTPPPAPGSRWRPSARVSGVHGAKLPRSPSLLTRTTDPPATWVLAGFLNIREQHVSFWTPRALAPGRASPRLRHLKETRPELRWGLAVPSGDSSEAEFGAPVLVTWLLAL